MPETFVPMSERVAAGVAALNLHLPGWHRRVDPKALAMSSSCDCVLGQLEDNFWGTASRKLMEKITGRTISSKIKVNNFYFICASFGFCTVRDETTPELTKAWKEEIRRLQATPGPSDADGHADRQGHVQESEA